MHSSQMAMPGGPEISRATASSLRLQNEQRLTSGGAFLGIPYPSNNENECLAAASAGQAPIVSQSDCSGGLIYASALTPLLRTRTFSGAAITASMTPSSTACSGVM